MVSEKAEEILGIEKSPASPDEVAVAFWLKTEEIDRRIIDTDDEAALERLLAEKDQLLEARALLEGISIQRIRREILERKSRGGTIDRRLLIAAIAGWLIVMGLIVAAIIVV